MVVLLGFAALTIDVGRLYNVKAELQNAADAAALAGASALADNSLRESVSNDPQVIAEHVRHRAFHIAALNPADQKSTHLAIEDVVVGRFDWDYPDQPLSHDGSANAVQVTARLTEGSPNGPVLNFFAPILGADTSNVSAMAIAAINDKLASYPPQPAPTILPFTVYRDFYEDQTVNGPDDYSHNEDLGVVENFGDGIPEVVVYPGKEWAESSDGAGNFGLLNIGLDSFGAPPLAQQMIDGVTPQQFEQETGERELTFLDDAGNPKVYSLGGTPGMKSSLEDELLSRVGEIVGIFLHTAVVDPGANAVYAIVSLRFGRLMEADINGERGIVFQPIVYTDPTVKTDPAAPSTGGLVGRVMIAR